MCFYLWNTSSQGTNSQKFYFMIFERGPRAFVDATYQTITRLGSNGHPVQYILHSASDMVSTKLASLTSMQHCLAAFLAEVCVFHFIEWNYYNRAVGIFIIVTSLLTSSRLKFYLTSLLTFKHNCCATVVKVHPQFSS